MRDSFLKKIMGERELKVFEFLIINNEVRPEMLKPSMREALFSLKDKGLVKMVKDTYALHEPKHLFYQFMKLKKNLKIITMADEVTEFQHIKVEGAGEDFLLELNGNPQVCSIDEEEYHCCIATIPCVFAKNLKRVLILGGGDYLAARNVLGFDEVEEVIQVEIDKRVMELFRTLPELRARTNDVFLDPRLQVINDDAFRWLGETDKKFDVIIYDAEETFTNQKNEPESRNYIGFYSLMFNKLRKGGVLTYNCSNDPEEEDFFNELFEKRLRKNIPAHVKQAVLRKRRMYQKQWELHKYNYKNVKRLNVCSPVVGFHSNWYFSNEKMVLRRGDEEKISKFVENMNGDK